MCYALLFWGLEREGVDYAASDGEGKGGESGQGHTFWDALYFAVVAATTIGYARGTNRAVLKKEEEKVAGFLRTAQVVLVDSLMMLI